MKEEVNIKIIKATIEDVDLVLHIQKQCFSEFLDKYNDNEINPSNESKNHLLEKIMDEDFNVYIIRNNNESVGVIKVKRISKCIGKIYDFGIIPKFRDKQIGTMVFGEIKQMYSYINRWLLSTILEEERNIYFYEKLGFIRTKDREPTIINEKITIVGYEYNIES